MRTKIWIGSRESKLAVEQSKLVIEFIRKHHPELEIKLLTMKTSGDLILDKPLEELGGKALFVKELDQALLDGRSDLSVHSLKDMPMEIPEEMPILAYSDREDPRDVLVLPEGMKEWDITRPVGCSSLRRQLQFKELHPEAIFKPVRGNVITRLKKLDEGEFGALILAAAGLKRLGLEMRINRYFEPEEMIPAAGQGILAIQGRKGEDYSYLNGLGSREATSAAICERSFVAALEGGCSSPAAAYARVEEEKIYLQGLYYDEETNGYQKGTAAELVQNAAALGRRLAEQLKADYQKKKCGKVWLVGAGPADPGLFTLKGKQVLEQAQVVVYDALVGQGVLTMIPAGAKLIDVGKRSGKHTCPQEEINEILVREAQAGNRVVRLKGGDPFLFGRGGEELEVLCNYQIPCEVIPGVTAALAVPAYNGIPVTHRDVCSSLHIINGHISGEKNDEIDFEALVRTKGTLIFLMGAAAISDICQGLLAQGMDLDMPAAILQKGTTAAQKRIVATVATLAAEAARQGVDTPAMVVVGAVCALAEKLSWYEELPLAGKKILVTRPRELSSELAKKLRDKGAEVLELPAIYTKPITPNQAFCECLENLQSYDWLAFTSPTGVAVFFNALTERQKDIRALGNIRIAAVGSGTGKALKEKGLYPDLMPEIYDGRAMGAALAKVCKAGERVLIPRAEVGNYELTEELKKVKGLQIEDIPTYHTFYESPKLIDERAELEQGKIDYVVFTSASTVNGFAKVTVDLDYAKIKAVCIGKQTRAAAAALGMETFMAEAATLDSVVACIEHLCGSSAQ